MPRKALATARAALRSHIGRLMIAGLLDTTAKARISAKDTACF